MCMNSLTVYFFLFALFCTTYGDENTCLTCPSFQRVLSFGPKSANDSKSEAAEVTNITCKCEPSLWYDESKDTCVTLEKCTSFNSITNLGGEVYTVLQDFSEGLDFQSLLTGDVMEFFKHGLINTELLSEKDFEKYEKIKDFELVKDVLQENIGGVFSKYSGYLSVLLNPFILKNSAVVDKCGNDSLCKMKYLYTRNKGKMKKVVNNFLPDLIDSVTGLKKELKRSIKYECEDDECIFIKSMLEAYDEMSKTMTDSVKYIKPFMEDISKYVDQQNSEK